VPTALTIIRQSSYTATPWKNGGGTTHEAIRVPAGGDSFRWRVSVANIEVSGPFSDFAGYRRTMVLLRGTGLTLKFANGEQCVLQKIGDLVVFDGAISTFCELHDGPCVDLNFMVSSTARAEVRILGVHNSEPVQALDEKSTLILSIADPMLLQSDAGETVRLEPWDLAVLSRGSVRLGTLKPAALSAPSAVFFATISP
jgi:environmental stress-induced protein Ves